MLPSDVLSYFIHPHDLQPFFESSDVVARGDYVSCLNAWLEHFPRNQIWTGFMEDVASGEEAAVLKSVFEFLGVDSSGVGIDQEEAKKVVNPRPQVPMPEGLREILADALYKQNDALGELLGRSIPWV